MFCVCSTDLTQQLQEVLLCDYQKSIDSLIDNASLQINDLDERVVAMYQGVRDILMKYRSGPMPKALKIVPNLANWEQVTDCLSFVLMCMLLSLSLFTCNLIFFTDPLHHGARQVVSCSHVSSHTHLCLQSQCQDGTKVVQLRELLLCKW